MQSVNTGGPCTLDITKSNTIAFPYNQQLLLAGIEQTMPRHAGAILKICEKHRLSDAFTVRRELVNFKKVGDGGW